VRLGEAIFLGPRLDGDPLRLAVAQGLGRGLADAGAEAAEHAAYGIRDALCMGAVGRAGENRQPKQDSVFQDFPSLRTRLRAPLVLLAVPCRQPFFRQCMNSRPGESVMAGVGSAIGLRRFTKQRVPIDRA